MVALEDRFRSSIFSNFVETPISLVQLADPVPFSFIGLLAKYIPNITKISLSTLEEAKGEKQLGFDFSQFPRLRCLEIGTLLLAPDSNGPLSFGSLEELTVKSIINSHPPNPQEVTTLLPTKPSAKRQDLFEMFLRMKEDDPRTFAADASLQAELDALTKMQRHDDVVGRKEGPWKGSPIEFPESFYSALRSVMKHLTVSHVPLLLDARFAAANIDVISNISDLEVPITERIEEYLKFFPLSSLKSLSLDYSNRRRKEESASAPTHLLIGPNIRHLEIIGLQVDEAVKDYLRMQSKSTLKSIAFDRCSSAVILKMLRSHKESLESVNIHSFSSKLGNREPEMIIRGLEQCSQLKELELEGPFTHKEFFQLKTLALKLERLTLNFDTKRRFADRSFPLSLSY